MFVLNIAKNISGYKMEILGYIFLLVGVILFALALML